MRLSKIKQLTNRHRKIIEALPIQDEVNSFYKVKRIIHLVPCIPGWGNQDTTLHKTFEHWEYDDVDYWDWDQDIWWDDDPDPNEVFSEIEIQPVRHFVARLIKPRMRSDFITFAK